ncbi:hypothetical protein AX15_005382 [Amanita polypyramis BW_CC]|nr:hypothetical protein AX15_005382 [Amanita polypyramis BW_CC]
MLGQNSAKEKNKSLSAAPFNLLSSPHTNSNGRNIKTTPNISNETATVSRSQTPVLANKPPIVSYERQDISDEVALISGDQVSRYNSREPSWQTSATVTASKRRSLSVGDADIKKFLANAPSVAQRRTNDGREWDDHTLNGIINDFKGQLSSLDPMSSASLDLRDPSTPARRLVYRSKAGNGPSVLNRLELPESTSIIQASVSPPDTDRKFGEETGENGAKPIEPSPIVPPRSSSLQMPNSPVRPNNSRTNAAEEAPGSLKPHHGTSLTTRDFNRLNVLHRPTASSSEPSLIPTRDDSRASSAYTSSQHDLTVNDLTLARFTSSNFSASRDEIADIESYGKELATRCWNEDTSFLAREKIAEYLGGQGYINKIALRHYIAFFNFSGLRLDFAFRRLCSKLFLKAETQQVDRILEEFSKRYWECNPSTLYGSTNVVHAVTYSLLLLNTDLHVADLATHMSRSQFVRNTLTAILAQFTSTQGVISDGQDDHNSSTRNAPVENTEVVGRSKRSDSITSWNSVSRDVVMSLPLPSATYNSPEIATINENIPTSTNVGDMDVKSVNISQFYNRAWENEMENVLKEMYGAIRAQQILQPFNTSTMRLAASPSNASPGMLRNRSLRSQSDRLMVLKRGSIRGLHSIITQSGASSNSSVDGRVSPSPSLATSTNEFQCSSSSFLTPSLGFASNLSNTIIRETHEDDDQSIKSQDTTSTSISISDEELALFGPPWAKEGILCRKQYWESTGKRAKDKSWLDVFVVIQKGDLNMFTFGNDNAATASNVIGGGNWLSSAHPVGTVHLAHSLAHSLPPPGYNRQRPYCMVLTLANGGVYFYQAGTEELVNEWVSTCNYWAARTSKEPLAGGVSNMEYGWNRVSEPRVYGPHFEEGSTPDVDRADSASIRSSRSNRSRFGWREGAVTIRHGNSPWADRIPINDWKAPLPPTIPSTHDEETQLDALRKHVRYLKNDLERHNELREPMMALYPPRSATALKAQSNWERKSQYLLTEIVKYESYIDSLQNTMALRLKKRGEKALERALNGIASPEPNGTTLLSGSKERTTT